MVDTSVIVKIDRHDTATIEALKVLGKKHELLFSTITIMEILTGSNMCKDAEAAVKAAKRLLRKMEWVPVDGRVAEKSAQLNAFLIGAGLKIELPDVIIAATLLVEGASLVLTFNGDHFTRIPILAGKVVTPAEAVTKD
ncbi:MAG: type II toxin-antitoxin system VapC family toxin [Candidatus Lokiarchaeota archaeon]|nr:type II toxin-antitoxin system VapC family toxin [Candidatus Lokiarchaeota archaeon]